MRLGEFFKALSGLEIFEKRTADENLIDLVFEKKNTAAWEERMTALLGPAVKPAGAGANGLAKQITKDFGGIRAEQTLYCANFSDHSIVVMFWPWQNGRCTTCKAFCQAVMPESKTKGPFWAGWFK